MKKCGARIPETTWPCIIEEGHVGDHYGVVRLGASGEWVVSWYAAPMTDVVRKLRQALGEDEGVDATTPPVL